MSAASTSRRSEGRTRRGGTNRRAALGRRKGRHEAAASGKQHVDATRDRPVRGTSRRIGRRIAVVGAIGVGTIALGGWWVSHTSIFSARHIAITGAGHLDRRDVLDAAGVHRSTNVLWADPSAIEDRLESDPWIAGATVTRSLPSSIAISVTERRPASTVVVGSTWFLVATDGTVLGPAKARPSLPVLPTIEAVTVGDRSAALTVSARIAGGMSPWLRQRVATVAPGADGTVQLGMDDGVRVLFGPATDVEAKSQALVAIIRWARERHDRLASIDVRSPVAPSAVPFDSLMSDPGLASHDTVVNGAG